MPLRNPVDDLSAAGIPIPLIAQYASSPARSQSQKWRDLPTNELTCQWIDDTDQLAQWREEWTRLAECCLCPNIFYEHQMLLPALRHLANPRVRVLIVRAPQRNQPGKQVLCGLVPIEIGSPILPVQSAKFWQHLHCFLATPLIRADVAEETLKAIFEFLKSEGIGLLHLNEVSAEGPFHQTLVDHLHHSGLNFLTKRLFQRSMFLRKLNDEEFFEQWPRKRRHEVGRHERRLCESGTVTVHQLTPQDCIERFADQFLTLESLGWKAQKGTAMVLCPKQASFLRESFAALAADGKFMGLTLALDGIAIAMKSNLLTHRGGFAFKIAYDPAWSRFSPGVILEKANVTKLHTNGIDWMDSCAQPDHPMINALWPQRRVLQSMLIATGTPASNAALAVYPAARYMVGCMRKARKTVLRIARPGQANAKSTNPCTH